MWHTVPVLVHGDGLGVGEDVLRSNAEFRNRHRNVFETISQKRARGAYPDPIQHRTAPQHHRMRTYVSHLNSTRLQSGLWSHLLVRSTESTSGAETMAHMPNCDRSSVGGPETLQEAPVLQPRLPSSSTAASTRRPQNHDAPRTTGTRAHVTRLPPGSQQDQQRFCANMHGRMWGGTHCRGRPIRRGASAAGSKRRPG